MGDPTTASRTRGRWCDSNRWFTGLLYLARASYQRGRFGRWGALVIREVTRRLFSCDVPPAVPIGPELTVPHPVGIVVGATASLGARVTIMPNVVIGAKTHPPSGADRRHADIGNDVLIGANAVVLGPVRIGDGAVVAAGAVVLDDVPPGSLAAGNPATVRPLGPR